LVFDQGLIAVPATEAPVLLKLRRSDEIFRAGLVSPSGREA
jgi:hypothetical protein